MADGEFDNLTVNNVLTIGPDTNLDRSAANVLKIHDGFEFAKDANCFSFLNRWSSEFAGFPIKARDAD